MIVKDTHWSEASECGADREASKAHLGDGCVDDTLLAELVQKALGDLEWGQ